MWYPRVPMASLWSNRGNKANWGNIQAIFFNFSEDFLTYNLLTVASFRIGVPSILFFQKNPLCHSFRIIVISSGLLSFLPDYCHSFWIIVIPSEYCHSFRIIQRITNTSVFYTLFFNNYEHPKKGHLLILLSRLARDS